MRHPAKRFFAVASLGAAVAAQDLVWERGGVEDLYHLGSQSKFIGDVDGDGYDDLITPVGWAPRNGQSSRNELWILSGRDGRTLRVRPEYSTHYPSYVEWGGAGDMDGDGGPDYFFLVYEGYPLFQSVVEVRSASDDRLILKMVRPDCPCYFFEGILGGRDLDGDGRADLIGRRRGDQNLGVVKAVRHDGSTLWEQHGTIQRQYWIHYDRFLNTGWVGDLDRDGADDFVLGGYDQSIDAIVAMVLSGRTGRVIVQGASALYYAQIGWCADGCGDVDRDGVPDFVASSWGGQGLDSVQMFSGRDGRLLRIWTDYPGPGQFMRAGGHDYDRDGVPDVIANYGPVEILSGRDGGRLHRLVNAGLTDETGRPQPGNPYPVFLVPYPGYGSGAFPPGRIRLYRGAPAGVEPFGTACTGTLPAAPAMGVRDLEGTGTRLHLSNAPAAAAAILVLGFSQTSWQGIPLPAPLDAFGFPGCSLYTSGDAFAFTTTGTAGQGLGFASFDLPLALKPKSEGRLLLHGQWLVLDPRSPNVFRGGVSDAALWRH
jgi:hypothetical protein